MAIIGGVQCEELRDGFEEEVNNQGPGATKRFLCDWADRYTVANALLGLTTGTGPGGSITPHPPMLYPESANMYAREISIEGKGKCTQGTQQLQFVKAVVTARFAVPQFGYTPQPYMSIDPSMPFTYATQELDFGREAITIEGSACTLANGHAFPSQVPYSVPLPHVVMSITLHQVPYLNAAAVVLAASKPLNNATFLGVQAGYLMFEGCKSHTEAMSDGSYSQAITLVFRYRPILRWDEVFDPDGSTGPTQVRYQGNAILQRSNLAILIPSAYGGQGA